MSYDFDRAAKLYTLYATIMKDATSQLNPIAFAAMEELQQMIIDNTNSAPYTDPNPGVDPSTPDHDGDGLVTTHDQSIEDGDEDEDMEDETGDDESGPKDGDEVRKTFPVRKV